MIVIFNEYNYLLRCLPVICKLDYKTTGFALWDIFRSFCVTTMEWSEDARQGETGSLAYKPGTRQGRKLYINTLL